MVGEHLKRFRKEKGLTQEALGKELGVTGQTVFRWEGGTRKIDVDLGPKVSEFTGIPKSVMRPDLAHLLKEQEPAQ